MSGIRKILLSSLVVISFMSLGLGRLPLAQAQGLTSEDLGVQYASSTGLTTQDPRVTVAKIIRIVLGFLGTIAVILVIYAGFMWMTSSGNEDKVTKAKNILKAAVIGLVIILSAFAITSFIINKLLESTSGPGMPPTPPGSGIITPGADLHITGVSPSDGTSGLPRNTTIRFQFNGFIDSGSVTSASAAVQASGETIAGQWLVNGREIVFKPDSVCTGSCGEVHCLPENGVISVHLTSDIKSLGTNPKNLVCGGLGLSCDLTFSVGSTIDCQDPQAEFISTIGICADTSNWVRVAASDDSSLARFEFLANGQQFYLATDDFGQTYEASAYWSATGTAGEHFTLKALVDDIASHQTTIEQSGRLLPAHCCNGQKDSDEEGIDCGGSCLGCHGSACATDQQLPGASCNNNLCRSGFCTAQGSNVTSCEAAGYATGTASCCLCKDKPRITSLSPRGGFCRNNHDQYCSSDSQCATGDTCDRNQPNAKAGNLVTIFGSGFGSSTGSVIFADEKLGSLLACGNNSWSDNQIIVKVPTGATTGIIQVKNSDNFIATSAQALIINNIARPGLCSLSKASGTAGEQIDYNGLNFESNVNFTIALYGTPFHPIVASKSIVSSPTSLKAIVPSFQPGLVTTFVRNDSPSLAGPASNFLLFNKLVDPGSEPQITNFEPTSGPPGQYVTIFGHGFGNIKGNSKVLFGTTNANYDFPEVCAASVWSDKQVIVKVPSGISGDQALKMELASGANLEASKTFTVTSTPLAPSLCLMRPTVGPPSTKIEVWGEYFRNYDSNYSKFNFRPNMAVSPIPSSWEDDGTLSRASAIVPTQAMTGPVRVVNFQGISNGLNFKVGSCRTNDDCLGQFCCPSSSANAGQCRVSSADCYGSANTCVYRWSFTTGSGNMSCPSSTTACGSQCCHNDTQLCVDDVCINKTLLSCNDYQQCNGALYCPNSPGWCSQNPNSTTIQGLCSDEYCKELFEKNEIPFSVVIYDKTINKCFDKDRSCDLARQVPFQLGVNKVTYSLTCEKGHWTTTLTAGQCPPDTPEYGQWQLLPNNVCQSEKKCTNCPASLQCLAIEGGASRCVLNQPICASGFKCDSGKCVKESQWCECCCDKNLNNKGDKTNPGCCLPLTCDGTCGSGPGPDNRDFGVCSGCRAVGPSTTTRDMACNCLGTSGKYCNTATAAGFCSDCAQLSKEECVAHSTCCYDMMLNKCRGAVEGNRLEDGQCGYYTCDGHVCANTLVAEGEYTTLADCEAGCRVITLQGESCNLATTTIFGPNYVQQIGCGYQFCSAPFSCLTATGLSVTSTNQLDCGICCCDPGDDQCNKLSPNLYCSANHDQCTGSNRGLCCGCQRDDECGNYHDNGCGQDSCCRARASLKTTIPENNAQAVCRNASIEAIFTKPMAINNLSNNVLLIADYGKQESCPNGTTYLASVDNWPQDSWWSKLKNRLLAWLLPNVLSATFGDVLPAPAGPQVSHTYCALNKTIKVKDKRLIIQPSSILPANRLIYVVLIADSDLEDGQAEGIIDQHGIGLSRGEPLKFNNLQLPATLWWSFKTSNEICRIDHVEVDPTSVLLSDMQASSTIRATAVDFTGQVLSPYLQYNWEWLWSVGNSAVVRLTADAEEAVLRPQNKKDAETYARATAQVTTDQAAAPGASLPSFSEDVLVRVFLCANPWPARQSDGSWQPWTDTTTNMQFYYCRDGQGDNPIADLPGLKVITSTDPQASSSAFYFFRYQPPTTAPVNVSASAVPAGGAVQLTWDPYSGASGYKVYYGLASGQYFSDPLYVNSSKTQATISGLINGQLYYFAVSAILQVDLTTFAETPVSMEAVVRPQDTVAPAAIHCLKQVPGKNRLDLTWQRNQEDTVGYRVEYKAKNTTGVGQILLVDQPVGGTEVRASIVGLIDPQNISVTVKAVDAAGNISSAQSSNMANCK